MTEEKTIQQLFPGPEEGLYEEMILHGTVKQVFLMVPFPL